MSIEALVPCCDVCTRPQGLAHCAFQDWLFDGTPPCSMGIRSVQTQVARKSVSWTPDNLLELGVKHLAGGNPAGAREPEGCFRSEGIEWARKTHGGGYFGGSVYRMPDHTPYKLLYVRLPLPDKNKATAMPMLLSDSICREISLSTCENDGFNSDSLVFGDEKTWNNIWQIWWRRRGTTLDEWKRVHKAYRQALDRNGFLNDREDELLIAVKRKMLVLVKSKLGN